MKLAILPELQKENNKHVNSGLHVINVLLFVLITGSVLISLTTYKNIHRAQNTVLVGPDGTVIGAAALMVPNWVISPSKIDHDVRLRLSTGAEVSTTLVRVQAINGVDVTLLKAEGIPVELLLNAAGVTEDARILIVDNGAEWTGRLRKQDDGLYVLGGDRQPPPGLPVTLMSDHTALIAVTATSANRPVVITIEQLQQAFLELK